MKSKRWFMLVALFLVVLSSVAKPVRSQDEYSNSGALLGLAHGARPMGMGGAFMGLADDENAVYYNPAALGFLEEFGVTTLWSPQFGLMDYGSIGFARKYVGLSTSALYSGPIDVPNEFGADTGTIFSYLSGHGVLGFGLPILPQISIGGKAQYYYSHLTLDSADDGRGWSVVPAIMAKEGDYGFGITVENALTSGLVYGSDHREVLRKKFRTGVAFSPRIDKSMRLNVLADLEIPFDAISEAKLERMTPHLGVELWFQSIGIRTGYDGRALTLGTSLEVADLRLDWALSAYKSDITETHRVSVVYRF